MRRAILAGLALAALVSAGPMAGVASAQRVASGGTDSQARTVAVAVGAAQVGVAMASINVVGATALAYEQYVGPMWGTVTVSAARVRQAPNTSSAIVGMGYYNNSIWVHCETTVSGWIWGWVKAPSNGRWGWMRSDLYRAGWQSTSGGGYRLVQKC